MHYGVTFVHFISIPQCMTEKGGERGLRNVPKNQDAPPLLPSSASCFARAPHLFLPQHWDSESHNPDGASHQGAAQSWQHNHSRHVRLNRACSREPDGGVAADGP